MELSAKYGTRETIFAPATGAGRSAIAVVRISGPRCSALTDSIIRGGECPERAASLRTLIDPDNGETLDRALVIRFSAPRSFTGEDMIELQVTGGRAVLAAVLGALSKIPGFRPAEPGEFAWRAFENGRLDLSEVEGIADLVDAETAAQRRQALRIAGGALRREAEALRDLVLRAMSTLESQIDFSDVEDTDALSMEDARRYACEASARIESALAPGRAGERLRDGLTLVIAGAPNVGKSTLMNALARRDVSIVSASAGTTRDVIEVALDLDGFPVTLVDTAGIRETTDPIEREGVERAKRRAADADLILWLSDHESPPVPTAESAVPTLHVRTKADQLAPSSDGGIVISAKTGQGLDALIGAIAKFAHERFGAADSVLLINERHRIAFSDARAALNRAVDLRQTAVELMAEDLRLAARAIERISGRIDVEDVLGDIFSRLCVGK